MYVNTKNFNIDILHSMRKQQYNTMETMDVIFVVLVEHHAYFLINNFMLTLALCYQIVHFGVIEYFAD